ncbi:TolC family protein [Flavobacterium muglaense]|uniref:TolC family protein n=1 Tax=Flavobacterium muglaense TaxID=2764716 RepID=A0A923N463_9FLAO|nr:TolC family protein [Flavobacterium muglaense]MBC5838798.1 TolC family protein [Flavobacterium muglaense]MBC5845318.1 TolC family protein [Flavobacterium muglaense]
MKVSQIMLFGFFFIGIYSMEAQDKTSLTLEQAIQMAWNKSNEVTMANTKVETSRLELQSAKNNQYPDFKISGQYQRLTKVTIDLKTTSSSSSDPLPIVDQLVLGQANATLPVFAGFKIKNSIKLSDQLYQAEAANAMQTKEEVAMKVVNLYASLYKAQKTVELLKENQKSAQQRVTDFIELEKNGIIPRNDLLKSQLQVSKIQLTLDRAISDLNVVNFELISLLKMDAKTKLEVRESDFADFQMNNIPTDEQLALQNRKDLEAIQFQEKASLANIKIAKSGYYPSIAILGGYTALNLKNVLVVQNAMNIGVGLSYDLSGILKNGTTVKIAESKALELQNAEAMLKDYIKIEVQKAIEDYDLALKQNLVYNQAVEQASENYRIIKDKYDNGLSDTNDLLEADVEQLGSKINKTLAKANVIQKYYELLSVSGQLNQTFNLSKI